MTSCRDVFVKDGCLLDIQRLVELVLQLVLAQRVQIRDDLNVGVPLHRIVTQLEQKDFPRLP